MYGKKAFVLGILLPQVKNEQEKTHAYALNRTRKADTKGPYVVGYSLLRTAKDVGNEVRHQHARVGGDGVLGKNMTLTDMPLSIPVLGQQ